MTFFFQISITSSAKRDFAPRMKFWIVLPSISKATTNLNIWIVQKKLKKRWTTLRNITFLSRQTCVSYKKNFLTHPPHIANRLGSTFIITSEYNIIYRLFYLFQTSLNTSDCFFNHCTLKIFQLHSVQTFHHKPNMSLKDQSICENT